MSYAGVGQFESETRGAAEAEKGGVASAAAMAQCIAGGGAWIGGQCIPAMTGEQEHAQAHGGTVGGGGGGGGGAISPVQPGRRAALSPVWLAAIGGVALVGGALYFTRKKK